MNERKFVILGMAVLCIISGIVGAMFGYRGWSHKFPSGERLNEAIWYGSIAGIVGAIITGILLAAAARGKMWLVAAVCCILTFAFGWFLQDRKIRDVMEWRPPPGFQERFIHPDPPDPPKDGQ